MGKTDFKKDGLQKSQKLMWLFAKKEGIHMVQAPRDMSGPQPGMP